METMFINISNKTYCTGCKPDEIKIIPYKIISRDVTLISLKGWISRGYHEILKEDFIANI